MVEEGNKRNVVVVERNNRNVLVMVVVVEGNKRNMVVEGNNRNVAMVVYSFTIHEAVLEKKVESRVDVGSIRGRFFCQ